MKLAARMQTKKWGRIAGAGTDRQVGQFAEELNVSPLLAQILINRQVRTAREARGFLNPKLSDLIEPRLMPGIEGAVKRIKEAIKRSEKIVIYGDYDVDGITGVAILWHLLRMLGAGAEYYIPHRIDEGYGLNDDAVGQIISGGAKLIITVDCGITGVREVELAKSLGADVIITDHHQPGVSVPDAAAIVHPGLDGIACAGTGACAGTETVYGNPDSAGAMVALKLAWAIVSDCRTGTKASPQLREFLLNATTLAAIGTIADVVDLRGENRILAHYGLKGLQSSKLMGLQMLIESAELGDRDLDSYDIAFRLAPMLNAAGRMGHARLAVELLTSASRLRCTQIAEYLKHQNRRRQKCQREIFAHARQMISRLGLDHPDRRTIVLAEAGWHSGVIGIVASRIIDEYFRPAVMINTSEEPAQGSARSVEGFNLYEALSACGEHLVSYGGHKMAAGLKIDRDRVTDFAEAFERYAQENMQQQCTVSRLEIDAVCRIKELSEQTVGQLSRLEPFGRGNPQPVFASYGVKLIAPPRRVGQNGDHLQISITDNTASVRCVGFGMGRFEKKLLETDVFNIAYSAKTDTFNGNSGVQLILADIQFD